MPSSRTPSQFGFAAGVYDVRPALKKELELFVDSILRSDKSVVDLLTADYTYHQRTGRRSCTA